MQVSDSGGPQNVAITESAAKKRKERDGEENIMSKQTAHGNSRIAGDGEERVAISPVKTCKNNLVQCGTLTSPPTKHTRVSKFETLLWRSHSIDDSTIKSMMSQEKIPKATIINDR